MDTTGDLKAILLSPFFFPEPISTGRYNTLLVKALADAGLRMRVVTAHPFYPDWRPRWTVDGLPNITIERGGAWLRYPRATLIRRLILEMWFLCFSLRRVKDEKILIAVLPPTFFLPVCKLFAKNAYCIGIVHDLQSVMAARSRSYVRRCLAKLAEWGERLALRACDRLIFLSHSMADRAIKLHGLNAKECCVHWPFASSELLKDNSVMLLSLLPSGFKHIVYSGALGEKQNPDALIECFVELERIRADVVCHCFSRGPIFDRLRERYGNSTRVRFHDLVGETHLAELRERSHLQFLPQAFGTAEAVLPSKLPDLIAAGVPILAIADEESEAGRIVVESGAGTVVHSWDPKIVATAALKLLDAAADRPRDQRRAEAARYVDEHFNLDRLVNEILESARLRVEKRLA